MTLQKHQPRAAASVDGGSAVLDLFDLAGTLPIYHPQRNCAGLPSEMFVPVATDKGTVRGWRSAAAIEACDGCVVQRECLEYGAQNDLEGVWGGVHMPSDPTHRAKVLRNVGLPKHGTAGTYRTGCRCDDCQAAHYRSKSAGDPNPAGRWLKHGSNSAYVRGCRCVDCRIAHNEYTKEWRARKASA
jgi:hypothetical protein